MPRLIVNADDFGLTPGVNRAILELHQSGVLTSATLMARAAATADAIEIARATPTLGVGCHVVLLDGDPMLPPAQIPTLVDPRSSQFRATLGSFLKPLLTSRIRPEHIEAEARAQIQSLQARGVKLTHIDTHKHTHMFPQVLRPILRAARSCGIHAVRNPFEPAWSIAATPEAPFIRRTEVRLLNLLAHRFRRIVGEEGFTTTDGSLGVLATGTLDASAIRSLLAALPAGGIYELVTHPGYGDATLAQVRTRLRASREIEREALAVLREPSNLELVSFAAV
jgi:hopanoid biosynthesis associated protein HpnK